MGCKIFLGVRNITIYALMFTAARSWSARWWPSNLDDLDDFVRPDSASSKAMNILLGPLFDVAGYAFAAAAVLAPFSGVNIVTRFEKQTGKSFSETSMVNYLGRITFFRLELFEIMSCHRQACWIFHHWKKVLTQMIIWWCFFSVFMFFSYLRIFL